MIELTQEQQRVLDEHPGDTPRVIDPRTNTAYVLLRAEVFERLKTALAEEEGNQFVRDLYPYMWEVFGRDGWDDPEMDVYNDPEYPGTS